MADIRKTIRAWKLDYLVAGTLAVFHGSVIYALIRSEILHDRDLPNVSYFFGRLLLIWICHWAATSLIIDHGGSG